MARTHVHCTCTFSNSPMNGLTLLGDYEDPITPPLVLSKNLLRHCEARQDKVSSAESQISFSEMLIL